MKQTSTEEKRGWGFPANSRKSHYFIEGRSFCGKWLYFGSLEDFCDDSPDNCTACKKRVKKLRLKEKNPMLKDVVVISEGCVDGKGDT